MKKSRIWLLVLFIITALGSHWLVVYKAPSFIMSKVFERAQLSDTQGYKSTTNTLGHRPPTTEKSRAVVRASPDLIYSICIYDLSDGPVVIDMHPGDNYHSLSAFDANTDNFFVVNDIALDGKAARVVVVKKGPPILMATSSSDNSETFVTESKTNKGALLIRRLAGTPEMLENAMKVRKADSCGRLEG